MFLVNLKLLLDDSRKTGVAAKYYAGQTDDFIPNRVPPSAQTNADNGETKSRIAEALPKLAQHYAKISSRSMHNQPFSAYVQEFLASGNDGINHQAAMSQPSSLPEFFVEPQAHDPNRAGALVDQRV